MPTPFRLASVILTFALACGPAEPPADDVASSDSTEPVSAAAPAVAEGADAPLPAVITAERNMFLPEGVEFDQTKRRFLVGSLREGTVFELTREGKLIPFASDPELVSSVGIEVDEERGRLLVANSNAAIFTGGGSGHAKLGVFDLATGERIAMVDLGATLPDAGDDTVFFANDLTVDAQGRIYVSDTRTGAIYRVDAEYRPSLLHRFEVSEDFSPNGLVAHPDGYLLIGGGKSLYKLPLDRPDAAAPVSLPEPIAGADGIVFAPNGALAIVANQQNRVLELESDDDWASARVVAIARYEVMASTAAVVDDAIYVVHPHFRDEGFPSVERVSFE